MDQKQVASGLIEILVISYQPGSYTANQVANAKDQADRNIRNQAGSSRIGRTLASQAAPAARQAIGSSSQDVLITITNGIINTENLDHHGHL